ncbi:MAG TPA: hypothetical protein DCM87_00910 [Planctomycetes bacterium]|nr:hypothetical protein [Planctomycetota bacterium]
MKHIRHILVAAVAALAAAAAAVVVLSMLVPADFGTHPPGWSYRQGSLKENAGAPPLAYAAEESCAQKSCHGGENPVARLNTTLRGGHKNIGCQACHGPGQAHVASGGAKDGPVIWKPETRVGAAEYDKLPKEEQQKIDDARAAFHVGFCMGCHQELAGKPASLPQVASFEKHRKQNGDGSEAGCTSCHSAHKPAM